jgi:hypothetical protein
MTRMMTPMTTPMLAPSVGTTTTPMATPRDRPTYGASGGDLMAVQPSVDYSATPPSRKLGIKPGSRTLLVAAPGDFDLEPVSDRVRVQRQHWAPMRFVRRLGDR